MSTHFIDYIHMPLSWLILLASVSGGVIVFNKMRKNASRLPLPPGPKGLPLLGNLLQLPQKHPWVTYKQWGEKYGSLVYVEAMGQPILLLNTLDVTSDLLERRASSFSGRPSMPAVDMTTFSYWNFAFMEYGPRWRTHRRVFHQYLNQAQIVKYHPIIELQVQAFMHRLMGNPKNFLEETQLLFGSIVMQVAYGSGDLTYNRGLIHDAEEVIQGFSRTAIPGRYAVNTFHFLRRIPSWFPGAAWKKELNNMAMLNNMVRTKPFNDAKERLARGLQSEFPSIADQVIEALPHPNDPEYPFQEDVARNVSLVSYAAGADTTVASSHALIYALAMYPEVQKRAQKQIDAVVGTNRLPTAADCAYLPYVQAMIKETSRWYSVTPIAVPHYTTEDVEYNGYFLPKGAIVLPNSWAIMHDPNIFKDPFEFKPERYLKDGQIDPSILSPDAAAFGFGRRICPGRHLSNESLMVAAASLLSVFDIKLAKDEQGKPVPLKLEVTSGIVSKIHPFDCEIVPRSSRHAALLQDV